MMQAADVGWVGRGKVLCAARIIRAAGHTHDASCVALPVDSGWLCGCCSRPQFSCRRRVWTGVVTAQLAAGAEVVHIISVVVVAMHE
jgi:hypothetical protein